MSIFEHGLLGIVLVLTLVLGVVTGERSVAVISLAVGVWCLVCPTEWTRRP